jgi:hypothetical protein
MAVDPNTGQTIIPINGGANLAGFMDPSMFGQIQSGQGQADQQSQLAQAMLQRGYTPNSGGFGAIAQMLQSAMGMKMLQDSQQKSQGLYQQYAQMQANAMAAKHAQDQGDADAAEKRAIAQATGIKEGDTQIGLKYAPQQSAADASAAAAKATALLPSESDKIRLETQGKIAAATAAAEVANRRGYIVSDNSGNQHVITPGGKEIYTSSSPGGGKLTAPQTAANEADVDSLKNLTQKLAGGKMLVSDLTNFTQNYTGAAPGATTDPSKLPDMIRQGSFWNASNLNPASNSGILANAASAAIHSANLSQTAPTQEVIATELKNTVSPYKTPEQNARIVQSHLSDVAALQKQYDTISARVASRQPPGAGSVPLAIPGPTNPGPQAAAPAVDPQAIMAELARRAQAQAQSPQPAQ